MNDKIRLLLKCILGVFVPPALIFVEQGLTFHFWLDLVITILLFWVGGAIYAFIVIYGLIICEGIAAGLLPPLAIYLRKGVTIEFWICLVLTLFMWFPGMVFAYFSLVREQQKDIDMNN